MTRINDHFLGLEMLAVLYSLPYALLMWGYGYTHTKLVLELIILFSGSAVAFAVAFCCLFFQNSSAETRAWVGSLCIAVAALIVWCIATYWKTQQEGKPSDRPLVQPESEVDDINEEEDDERRSQQGFGTILDTIRKIPNLVYRRGSIDSDKTAV